MIFYNFLGGTTVSENWEPPNVQKEKYLEYFLQKILEKNHSKFVSFCFKNFSTNIFNKVL